MIVVSTVLNAGYFLPIVFRAFFREPAQSARAWALSPARRLGRSWLALTATAAGTVLLFLSPEIPLCAGAD